MNFSIRSISTIYGVELKRLFVFTHVFLPLLSIFSLITGWYFLSHLIVPSILPNLSLQSVSVISMALVTSIELLKYFTAPVVTKSIWHKDYVTMCIATPWILLFFGTSIFFSVQGVQEFYDVQDTSHEQIETHYQGLLDSIEHTYQQRIAQKDEELEVLEQEMGENTLLNRIDRINRQIRRVSVSLQQASNDSIKEVYTQRLDDLSQEKRLITSATAKSTLQVNQMNILVSSRTQLQEEFNKRKQAIDTQKQESLKTNQTDTHFIRNNILCISLGIELLILISLSYIQGYKLKAHSLANINSRSANENDHISPIHDSVSVNTPSDIHDKISVINGTASHAFRLKLPEQNVSPIDTSRSEAIPTGVNGRASSSSTTASNQQKPKRKRLSASEKASIRKVFETLEEASVEATVQKLMREYGVSRRTIYRIRNGQ